DGVISRGLQLDGAQPRQRAEPAHRGARPDVVGHQELDLAGPLGDVVAPGLEHHLDNLDLPHRVGALVGLDGRDDHAWSSGASYSGSSGDRSARSPLARTRPPPSASVQASDPVASAIQVSASTSTTAGGGPRVWRTPATAWTAP